MFMKRMDEAALEERRNDRRCAGAAQTLVNTSGASSDWLVMRLGLLCSCSATVQASSTAHPSVKLRQAKITVHLAFAGHLGRRLIRDAVSTLGDCLDGRPARQFIGEGGATPEVDMLDVYR